MEHLKFKLNTWITARMFLAWSLRWTFEQHEHVTEEAAGKHRNVASGALRPTQFWTSEEVYAASAHPPTFVSLLCSLAREPLFFSGQGSRMKKISLWTGCNRDSGQAKKSILYVGREHSCFFTGQIKTRILKNRVRTQGRKWLFLCLLHTHRMQYMWPHDECMPIRDGDQNESAALNGCWAFEGLAPSSRVPRQFSENVPTLRTTQTEQLLLNHVAHAE